VQRLTVMFEERVIKALCGMLSIPEQAEMDYEITPAPFPFQQDDGTMGIGLGMNVSLAVPVMAVGDHVMVTGMVQDPYAIDAILASNIGELLTNLRKLRTEANSISNGGGLFVPPGARKS
jgi:hypothetical protein